MEVKRYTDFKFKACVAILIACVLLFTHVVDASILVTLAVTGTAVGLYWAAKHVDTIDKALSWLEAILADLLLIVGDCVLGMVSRAVNDDVSLDRVVFGDIEKLSVNFWQNKGNTSTIAGNMSQVVTYWYNIFRNIAVVVYLIVLIYVAIKILLSSTGEGRAKYTSLVKEWIVGVGILFLFPYVMKYTVELNDALVQIVRDVPGQLGTVSGGNNSLSDKSEQEIAEASGTDKFSEIVGTEGVIGTVRKLIVDNGRIILVFIYYIMIGQTIVILCMYYKRAFMIGFLITIFPLVAMTYTIDKLRR